MYGIQPADSVNMSHVNLVVPPLGQNNPPVLFIEHSFTREILIAWQDPVCARVRHILATTGRFTGAATGVEGEADNDCYSSFGNLVCYRWVLRAHTAAHDVAMALRSSGIDARTYLCRVPLDRIDVRMPQCRTHSHP